MTNDLRALLELVKGARSRPFTVAEKAELLVRASALEAALDAQAGMVLVPKVVLELAAEAGQPSEVADFAASLLAALTEPVEGGDNG